MLGMTIAHRLAQHGQSVELFEASSGLGGLASAWQLGDVTWDRHYHVTLLSDTALRSLLEELGLAKEMNWVETKTGFYTDNKLYSMSNTLEFLTFPPLGLISKLRLGATIFYASRIRNWKRLEKVTVSVWLRRLSGRSTFEKMWLPLLRAKLGENYQRTSAAFIWATIARMYAARRTGLKKEMFGYVSGGYARVLDRFADLLHQEGVRINSNCKVNEVRSDPGGKLTVSLADGRSEKFDNVILTAPSAAAAGLCRDLTGAEKQSLRDVQYQGIVCASLLLRKPLASFYVTNITDPAIPFTAVIEMSALVDTKYFGGNALVYLPKYVDPEDPFLALEDEKVRELFVAGLERMYPGFERGDIVEFRVSRVSKVFPLPIINYSEKLPTTNTSVRGLHIVNSTQIVNGTLNVNETVQLANRIVSAMFDTQERAAGVSN